MTTFSRCLRGVASLSIYSFAVGLTCGTDRVVAQAPPAFGELPLATGATGTALTQLGKIALYDDGKSVFAWSAHTRRWVGLRKPAQAFVRQANDWALVQGTTSFAAFSAIRGTWEIKQLSSAATVLNPASQRNDSMLLVRDGAKVHGFSGFVGTWSDVAIPTTAKVVVKRHAAIATDGKKLWGVGAFDMQWREQSTNAASANLWADSFGAFAESGGFAYGYSAQTRRWSSIRLQGTSFMRVRAGDVGLWYASPTVTAWSALRGTFVTQVVGNGPVVLEADRQVGVASNASGTFFFSAPLASWLRTSIASTALRSLDSTCVLAVEPTKYHAYSALRGSLDTIAERSRSAQTSRALAAVVDISGKPRLYSSITGRWHAPPSNASSKPAKLVAHAAIVETQSGFAAFSARTGRYTTLAASGGSVLANPATSILAVLENSRWSVFDDRSERWLHRARTSSTPPSVWRTVLLGREGNDLVGYGSQSGRIEARDVRSSVAPFALRASSELATAMHGKGVWAYSPLPEMLTAAQFPEFRRIWTLGTLLPVYLSAPPRSVAVPIVGARLKSTATTPFGSLELTPQSLVLGSAITFGSVRSARFEIAIPNLVALRGVEVAWQGLVLPPSPASAYLTRSASTQLR